MKKLVLLIFLILLLPTVLAIETTLKQEYQPGETLIAEISGNFISPLKAEQIQFYSGRLFIPMIYDIAKMQDKYWFYALLPNKQRNYTLIIKQAHYFEAGEEKLQDLSFDFSVRGNLTLFSVNPGFIITNKNFDVEAESKVRTLTVTAEFLNSTQNIEIGAGKTKTMHFSVAGVDRFTTTSLLLIAGNKSYKLPVAVFIATQTPEEITLSEDLRFSKSYINLTVLKNQEFQSTLTLLNTGQRNIENISLNLENLENIIKVQPEKIDKLEAGQVEKITLIINSDEDRGGKLQAVSEDNSAEISLSVKTIEDKKEFETIVLETEIVEEETCESLEGEFCKADEKCEGKIILTIDGSCCIGNCKKQTNFAKIISLLVILIILAIIGFFVFKKLKMGKKTSEEVLKEKSKKYEERLKTKKPEETRGKLSRV